MQLMQMQAAVENPVTRTLSLALSTLGSLEQWMEGEGRPPTRVYMKALDLVASGPFSRHL